MTIKHKDIALRVAAIALLIIVITLSAVVVLSGMEKTITQPIPLLQGDG